MKTNLWNQTTVTLPPDEEVEITHPDFMGTRTAKPCPTGWRLTDCVHPAQNSHVPFDGSAWRGLQFATEPASLSIAERSQLAEILDRRANEIASFKRDMEEKATERAGSKIQFYELPGSVELAFSREIQRLRKLADKVRPPSTDDEEEGE